MASSSRAPTKARIFILINDDTEVLIGKSGGFMNFNIGFVKDDIDIALNTASIEVVQYILKKRKSELLEKISESDIDTLITSKPEDFKTHIKKIFKNTKEFLNILISFEGILYEIVEEIKKKGYKARVIDDSEIRILKPSATYNIPGGSKELRETAQQAAIREVKEETGIDISADNMVYLTQKYNTHFYRVSLNYIPKIKELPSSEFFDMEFVKTDKLPPHLQRILNPDIIGKSRKNIRYHRRNKRRERSKTRRRKNHRKLGRINQTRKS
jgi:hypothetical protein